MSKKKHKKRHSQSTMNAKRQAAEAKLADEKDRAKNRMNPTARNILLGDMVFLAVCQLLYSNGMLSDLISGVCTIIGTLLLFLALWIQFGKKNHNGPGNNGWSF